jgi:RimJ/RimL family protein N-acetyltransferase
MNLTPDSTSRADSQFRGQRTADHNSRRQSRSSGSIQNQTIGVHALWRPTLDAFRVVWNAVGAASPVREIGPSMPWRAGGTQPPVACRGSRHVLLTAHLRLQTPVRYDQAIMFAAASDPEAQAWLGWPRHQVVAQDLRDALLAQPPRHKGRRLRSPWGCYLIAVDKDSGLAAGAGGLNLRSDAGGWLAPGFRGRGLGTELFAAIAALGHEHLGAARIRAGTDPANIACVAALLAAGFLPAPGPEVHLLPDGRIVAASWFQHDTDQTARCDTRPRMDSSPGGELR